MKRKQTRPQEMLKPNGKQVPRSGERNPELIEKFYKQLINSFGYAYPAKV